MIGAIRRAERRNRASRMKAGGESWRENLRSARPLGFFDQAVAAPSKKAGARGLGLEQQPVGAAWEADDPRSSRRPWRNRASYSGVRSARAGPFTEHAAPPTDLAGENVSGRPKKPATKRKKQPREGSMTRQPARPRWSMKGTSGCAEANVGK